MPLFFSLCEVFIVTMFKESLKVFGKVVESNAYPPASSSASDILVAEKAFY